MKKNVSDLVCCEEERKCMENDGHDNIIENNSNNPPFFVDIKNFENMFNVLFKLKNKEKSKYSIPK